MIGTKISDLPQEERPFEKFIRLGAGSLSDAELLALVIRSGTKGADCVELAGKVLKASNGLTGLASGSIDDLISIPGIGTIRACQLLCIGELSKRIAKRKRPACCPLNDARMISERYMEEMRHLTEEHVLLLLLDAKCCLIKEVTLGIGSVNRSILGPREAMISALKNGAVNIVLLHNHPSGDPKPSPEDLAATKRVKEAGKIVGIPLVDHIIIGDRCYISFQEEGLLN